MQDSLERSQMRSFIILETATSSGALHAPRLGRFALPGRHALQTPGYLPTTSRGAVPHVAHDVLSEKTGVKSVYVGFEDFIERQRHEHPPIYRTPVLPGESALRRFMCMPDDMAMVLGPRRVPPVPCPTPSSNTSVTIMSSDGYRQLSTEQYLDAVRKLRPDIVIGLADVVADRSVGKKRRERMVDRTHGWTTDAIAKLYTPSVDVVSEAGSAGQATDAAQQTSSAQYFAPLLPVSKEQQHLYISDLQSEDVLAHLSGLALYDFDSVDAITPQLAALPRLALVQPQTPHDVLRGISLGVDLITVPFAPAASDGGIALSFTFPAPTRQAATPRLPLAIDMWLPTHTSDKAPLTPECTCYACTTFSRAYIRHLLNAKEMFGWTLLQIHNFAVLDRFFAGVRSSIASGTFEADVRQFAEAYEEEMPVQTGQGPRLRGYQFKTEKGDAKRNERVYGRLDETVQKYGEGGAGDAALAAGVN
ncbi:hypothetical protein KEM52_000929 [Ascosphaera acerosa]|nr:hypothetical protein KEM52_000929 [Ascosphaera acerosa]